MTLSELRTCLLRLNHDERGSSLTEFTFFLPIWIVVFVGIMNLGDVGIFSTKIQLQAQKELWDKVIQVTEGFEGEHMSPRIAAFPTAAGYFDIAGHPDNPQQVLDNIEGGASFIGMQFFGHYGESFDKSLILQPIMPNGINPTFSANEVLGQDDSGRFPHRLLNDTLLEQDFGGGFADIIGAVIGASGFVPALGAGVRYGSVFSFKSGTKTFYGGAGSYGTEAGWDAIVGPRALTGTEADLVPVTMAFVMFKLDDKYLHYQQFGKENWGGGFGAADVDAPSSEEDFENQNQDAIDAERDAQCDAINNSGYDPDADPPQPKPPGWDECQ